MEKNKIIKKALMELGFPFSDADMEEAENYKAASFVFSDVLIEVMKDENYGFNIKEERLNLTDRKIHNNKYEYAKPKLYLKSLTPSVEEFGDKLFSQKNNFLFRYLYEMDLSEIPETFERILVLSLAIKLAPTVGKVKALNRLYTAYQVEREKIVNDIPYVVDIKDLV